MAAQHAYFTIRCTKTFILLAYMFTLISEHTNIPLTIGAFDEFFVIANISSMQHVCLITIIRIWLMRLRMNFHTP